MKLTALATKLSGNSSRMIPNDSGNTPPPTPCTMRATIITPMDGARAATNDPTDSAASETTSIRFLPTASPRRPMMGVKIEADSRYAVNTQVTVLWSVFSSCSMRDSTGTVIDCISANEATATARREKDTQ